MVFAHLQEHEKDAFFSLLDEYFSSRNHIFSAQDPSSRPNDSSTAAANTVSAARAAFTAHPEAAAKIASAGLRQFGGQKSTPPAATASDPEVNMAGRVAAASRAFSAINTHTPSSSAAPPVAPKPASASLTSVKKFGDVDTSSLKNVYGSLRNANANKSAVHPPPEVAPALPRTNRSFGPPPHRVPSSVSTPEPPASTPSPPPPAPPPPPPPPAPPVRHEEPQGEWAEVLYDYESEEPGDLNIKENQRILVIERTSDDWWTGEVNGKKGLFPASYVQLL